MSPFPWFFTLLLWRHRLLRRVWASTMIMLILPFTPPNSFFPPKEALARRKEKLRKSTSLSLAISLLVLVKMRWVVRPVLLFSLVFISRDGSQSGRGVLSQQKSRCQRTKLLGHLHLWLLDRDLSSGLSRRGPNHNLWICCWRVHYQSITRSPCPKRL